MLQKKKCTRVTKVKKINPETDEVIELPTRKEVESTYVYCFCALMTNLCVHSHY